MEKFPNLSSSQVALLRVEFSTGHILDEQFKLAINDQQKIYTVFASLDEAKSFAKKILLETENIEVIIYGAYETVLNYLRAV